MVEARQGVPVAVGRVPVAIVREEWRVSDRWWTDAPVRRRYYEVVLESGENVVVFRDEARTAARGSGTTQGGSDAWFRQRA